MNNHVKNKIIEKSQYFLIIIPLISVYLPTIVYPVTEEIGSNVTFRPPGIVFAIVWPILLILLGISWFLRRKKGKIRNILYVLLTILLSIWFILYNTNKYYGLIDIIICFCFTLFLFFYDINKSNKYEYITLIPLICWLIFASILNIASIIN